ncbi:hypothetical protein JAAARDRAFT_204979 [Jaapia argillacea MUCL 33604]|uniref:Vacuolar membrane-associated protein IML1 n=1 Tax=Jaapia argillacea MUCL 33604 TaxID=933084 RepID=A0A067Q513_9AGAM|nr:hypothetical protein JAAARDRAFT_204979 [Jaapia argillacea MUCL 33604]
MSTSRAESQNPFSRRRSNTAQSILRDLPVPQPNPPQIPSAPPTPLKIGDSKKLIAWVHDPKEKELGPGVVFNAGWWPGVKEGDVLRVCLVGSAGGGAGNKGGAGSRRGTGAAECGGEGGERGEVDRDNGLFFVVQGPGEKKEGTKEGPGVKHQLQISIPKPLAETFGIRTNVEVTVTKVDSEKCSADHVEFIFQDQYLGRNDMWRLGKQLVGQCVYVDQEIMFLGAVAARIQNIYIDGKKVSSACISPTTKTIFRSLSARVTIFIQVCRELWEFAGDGERYNEKIVHSFLPSLFSKWRESGTNHTVTIVLISRVYYDKATEIEYAAGPLRQDDDGGWYKDFFKVITDLEVVGDWRPTLVSLKDSFWAFQRDILLTHHYHRASVTFPSASAIGPPEQVRLVGHLSFAHDGPILEAINLGLNPTETHYVDRSLSLTGSSTILITPGTGYFRVSKQLLRLTTVRLLDQGFGLDLVSLAKPPLHQSPIFAFRGVEPEWKPDREGKTLSRSIDPLWGGDDDPGEYARREKETFWWEPFWMSVSFWDKQMDLPFREDRFIARAKMYEIQMLGLLDHDVLSSIEVPFLPERVSDVANSPSEEIPPNSKTLTKREADQFDLDIFALDKRSRQGTTSRNSLSSSASGTILPSSSFREKRSSFPAQRTSNSASRIAPIEESPRVIHRDLPSENISDTEKRISMTSNLSTSPSQSSIRSNRSNRSTTSNTSERLTRSGTLPSTRSGIASKFAAASWFINAFRPGPSQTQTTPPSTSTAPTPHVVPSSPLRIPLPVPAPPASTATPIPASLSRSPRPMAIKGTPGRSALARTLEDESNMQHRVRISPINTPPRDEASFGKRRSVGLASLPTAAGPSSPTSRANPSRPRSSVAYTQSSLARRWEHMFPTPWYKHEIKWSSMVTPGCLPLTTDYFPSATELETSYDVFSYDNAVDPSDIGTFLVRPPNPTGNAEDDRRAWALVIMRGMVAVRLAQGYQLILQPKASHDPEERIPLRRTKSYGADEEMAPKPHGASEVLITPDDPVYLSMSNEIHRITYVNGAINTRQYVRRCPPTQPFKYQCLIWPKLGVGYTELSTAFMSHGLENNVWNRLDMLIAGYEHQFLDTLRYWRTRFVVIPTDEPPMINTGPSGEKLNDEEARLLGMDKLADMFSRLRWRSPEDKKKNIPLPSVRFLPTDLSPASCVLDEHLMAQLDEIHEAGPLKKKMKSERDIGDPSLSLAAIAKAMREEDGVPIKDRKWHRQRYTNAFTGYDFVSWLVREFRDVSTREQGVEAGAKLQERGLFDHCRGKHGFLDGHYFYQLKGEYAVPMTPTRGGWFRSTRHLPPTSDDTSSIRSGHYPSAKPIPAASRKTPKSIILSQSMPIDIDPNKKSDQAECVILHHDIIHNPATCFHFELHWIGTTARCIDDILRQWSRTIERYGLKLVEAYVTQIGDIRETNPFQSCFPIRLSVPCPFVIDLENRVTEGTQTTYYFEYAILKRFGFVLDVEASNLYPSHIKVHYSYRRSPSQYTQFVHRSGVAFVQIQGKSQGFLFLTNRLMGPGRMGTALKGSLKEQRPSVLAEQIRIKLHEFCSDPIELTRFYDEELTQLMHLPPEPPPLAI